MRLKAYAIVAGVLAGTLPSLGEFAIFGICPEHPASQFVGSVDGTVVFWDEATVEGTFVYGKDLSTGQIFTVGDGLPNQMRPAVSGDLVAWDSKRDGNWDIYVTNYRTGQESPVCLHPAGQTAAAISGQFVVWQDGRNSPPNVPPDFTNSDIYGRDMATGQELAICKVGGDQLYPQISGDIVVWTDYRAVFPGAAGAPDVYGYDLASGKEFLIAEHGHGPAISADLVVWNAGGDIWGKYLSDGAGFPICVAPNAQGNPDVDGRWVVWAHAVTVPTGTDRDIYGYDLLTGREFPIYVGPGVQDFPRVSADLVVWTSYVPGYPKRMYGAYIPEPASGVLLLLACLPLLRRRRRRNGDKSD